MGRVEQRNQHVHVEKGPHSDAEFVAKRVDHIVGDGGARWRERAKAEELVSPQRSLGLQRPTGQIRHDVASRSVFPTGDRFGCGEDVVVEVQRCTHVFTIHHASHITHQALPGEPSSEMEIVGVTGHLDVGHDLGDARP